MQNTIFAFIGTGNMGGALARAARQALPGENILLANRTPEKAAALARELGARAVDNAEAAARADYLFLGVKPQMMAGMLSGIRDALAAREAPCVLVTMAAGLSIAKIREMAGGSYPVIRIMPNLPVAVGKGMVLCCVDGVGDEQMKCFCDAMAGAGLMGFVDEGHIDAASAVAGCGPAYAAMLVEGLADGGVACGLPRADAQRFAAQMLLGTAAMLLEKGMHPGALKDAVCSPGGTTIQGVRALEARGFRSAAMESVIAAYEKTLALAGK